jgi:hypothetical protein
MPVPACGRGATQSAASTGPASGRRRLLDGVPTVLVAQGHIDETAVLLARIAPSDDLEAAQQMHPSEG